MKPFCRMALPISFFGVQSYQLWCCGSEVSCWERPEKKFVHRDSVWMEKCSISGKSCRYVESRPSVLPSPEWDWFHETMNFVCTIAQFRLQLTWRMIAWIVRFCQKFPKMSLLSMHQILMRKKRLRWASFPPFPASTTLRFYLLQMLFLAFLKGRYAWNVGRRMYSGSGVSEVKNLDMSQNGFPKKRAYF